VTETLRGEAFSISACEGMVLVEAPGVAVTLDVEAASLLSDQLLAACGMARIQQHAEIDQPSEIGLSLEG
jgi:hypothetical protein